MDQNEDMKNFLDAIFVKLMKRGSNTRISQTLIIKRLNLHGIGGWDIRETVGMAYYVGASAQRKWRHNTEILRKCKSNLDYNASSFFRPI